MSMARKWGMIVFFAVLVLTLGFGMASAQGQKFPNQPVDLIIGYGVGGGADMVARMLQPGLEKALGVSAPVSNISGASGDVGLGKVVSRKADGYAVGYQNSNGIINIGLGTSPFKMEDFTYLCRTFISTFWIFTNAEDSRFKTWDDIAKFAKDNPNKLTVATEGVGGHDELLVRFLAENGIKLKMVPYATPQQRYTSVVGKHEDLLIEQVGDVMSFITNKQLRPMIVFDQKRDKGFPDVVCSYEKDLKYDSMQFRGFILKGGVPAERVKILSDAFHSAYKTEQYQKALKGWSVNPEEAWMDSGQFTDYIKKFHVEIRTLAKKYGMLK